MLKEPLQIAVLVGLLCLSLNAKTWDLARDWSDGQNPGGVWSYEQAPNLSGSFTTVATQSGEQRVYQVDPKEMNTVSLLSDRVEAWLETDFSGLQSAWRVPGGVPGLCKSVGLSHFDFPKDDAYVKSFSSCGMGS